MASYVGTNGKVTIPTTVLGLVSTTPGDAGTAIGQITRWELTVRRDIHPDDTFDTTLSGKAKRGGMHDGVFTIEGFMTASKTLALLHMTKVDETPASGIKLEMESGKGFSFTGIFSDFTMSTPKTGLVTFRGTGESSGNIVETVS